MLRATFIVLAMIIGLGSAWAGEGSADAARAEQAFRNGDFEQAQVLASRALEAGGLTPAEEAHLRGRRGSIHMLLGELYAARADFDAAVALSSRERLGHWGLAMLGTMMAQDAAAAGAARSALAVAPGDYESLTLLGISAWKMGDDVLARTSLENARRQNPQRGFAMAILAAMAQQDGRRAEAQSLFQEAGRQGGAGEVLMLAIMGAIEGDKARAVEFACIAYRSDPSYGRAALVLELLDTAPSDC